jgi:hypothetical protein
MHTFSSSVRVFAIVTSVWSLSLRCGIADTGPSFPPPVGSPGAAEGPYHGFGYEWENNSLGMDHAVPQPWTPVRCDGKTVSVWGREFSYASGHPWPDRITSAHQQVLARPIEVHLRTNQGAVAWNGASQIGPLADDAAQVRWHGADGGLAIEVNSSIEFDGFLRIDVLLTPTVKKLSVEQLVVDIPFAKNIATYYSRGFSYDFVNQKKSAASWRGEIGDTAGYLVGDRNEPFVNHFWIGNENAGAEIDIPSDYNWSLSTPARAIEVHTGEKEATLRLNMVTKPRPIEGPTTFSFALLPTPIKPISMADHRQDVFLGSSLGQSPWVAEMKAQWRLYAVLFSTSLPLDVWGLPLPPRDPERRAAFDRNLAKAIGNGLHVIPYSAACLMADAAPGFADYRRYWVTSIDKEKRGAAGNNVTVSLYAKSIRDFLVYQHVQAAKTVPQYAGLYFDVADIAQSVTNPNATEYDMAQRPEAHFKPVYEMRDFYKRVYNAVKAVRPDYVVVMHQAKVPIVFGAFADVVYSGEGLNATFLDAARAMKKEGKLPADQPLYLPDYSLLSDGFWRSCYVPQGYVNVLLPMVTKVFPNPERVMGKSEKELNTWFATNHATFVTKHTREMLSRILVLDVFPSSGRCDTDVWRSVWTGFEQIGGLHDDVTHIPFWNAGSFIHTTQPAMFVAYVHRKAQNAIVIGANWSSRPMCISGELDIKALGITASTCRVTDIERNTALQLKGATLETEIPANDYRFLLLEASR